MGTSVEVRKENRQSRRAAIDAGNHGKARGQPLKFSEGTLRDDMRVRNINAQLAYDRQLRRQAVPRPTLETV